MEKWAVATLVALVAATSAQAGDEQPPYKIYYNCNPQSCEDVPAVPSKDQCVSSTNPSTRYINVPELERDDTAAFRKYNASVRAWIPDGQPIPPQYLLPETPVTNTIIVTPPGRIGVMGNGTHVATEADVVTFRSDPTTGRIYNITVEVRQPPERANPKALRTYWDPRLGFKHIDTRVVFGAEDGQLPGKTIDEKGQYFDAILDHYLKFVPRCGVTRAHQKALAIAQDPTIAAVDTFFQPCDGTQPFCQPETFGFAPKVSSQPDPLGQMGPVMGALANNGNPVNANPTVLNQQFNRELIHTLRIGLLNTQAELLTYVSADPAFAATHLGHGGGDEVTCGVSYNQKYNDAIAQQEGEIRSTDPKNAQLRKMLIDRENKKLVLDLIDFGYWQCHYNTSPTGAFTAEADENMSALKQRDKELGLMDQSDRVATFSALRDALAKNGFDVSAYDESERHCRSNAGRDAYWDLRDKIEKTDIGSPVLDKLFNPGAGDDTSFLKAVRTGRLTAINRIRDSLGKVTGYCKESDKQWDPTSWPSWLGGTDDGVPFWKDHNVVADVVRRYAAASPPRFWELEQFRKIACHNGALQSNADHTKFWIDFGAGVGLVALTVATAGEASGVIGLAARAVMVADVAAGVAQGVDMINTAQSALEHQKMLLDSGYGSVAEVEQAASELSTAYWTGGMTAAMSLGLAASDLVPLARAAFKAAPEGGFVAKDVETIEQTLRSGRQIPEEVLGKAVAVCRAGDCEAGQSIMRLWAKEPAAHEAMLRQFELSDWEAFDNLSNELDGLQAKMTNAWGRGSTEEYEALAEKYQKARKALDEYLEGGTAACSI